MEILKAQPNVIINIREKNCTIFHYNVFLMHVYHIMFYDFSSILK